MFVIIVLYIFSWKKAQLCINVNDENTKLLFMWVSFLFKLCVKLMEKQALKFITAQFLFLYINCKLPFLM